MAKDEVIKEYLKKINKYNSGSKNYVSNKIKRQYYSNLQKANANNAEKEFERKYNDYLIKQENLLNIVYDIQQVDSNKRKNLYKNNKKKLKMKIRKGIPDSLRGEVWLKIMFYLN